VASDSDGSHLIAGAQSDYVYTSSNSGASWTKREPAGGVAKTWHAVASDSDGSNLIACGDGDTLYTSSNSGASWTKREPGGLNWKGVASDSDGSNLIAGALGTDLYTSSNSGASWTEREPAGGANWYGVASDSDGSNLAAVNTGGYVYTSSDSGATWTQREPGGSSKNWRGVASDSDGSNLIAGAQSDYVYTGVSPPNLQSYSSTIKQQGSYSLKAIALQTDSLSDTLTKTVSPTKDLTGKNIIKLDARASRTGSNFKIGIHDSGGTTTEHTVNIASANIWQTETWDISGVSSSNKDAIDQIKITILNAGADNTFYIDNMYAIDCSVDSDCGLCKKCSSNTCVNQIATEDLKDECSASWNACWNQYQRRGPDGYCDGEGACDTNDASLNVSAGNVCSSGSDVNPSAEINCGIWSDCITGNVSADEYYVGYVGNGTSTCVDTDWQSAGTLWNTTTGYTIDTTEHADTCSESDITPPTITLNIPTNSNNSIDINSNVIFNCSATDNADLANITLYNNANGTLTAIETKTLTGTSNSTLFNRDLFSNYTIKDTTITWNCEACDSSNNCANASANYTFSGWDLGTYANATFNTSVNYIGLAANGSGQYPNTTGYYTSKIFNATFVAGWKNISWGEYLPSIPSLELDYMEYSSNASAQAAYVSSDAAGGYGTDVTATMTSYTAPSPNVVSDSTHYGSSYGWKAFDKTIATSNMWDVGTKVGWLKYDFGVGYEKTITKYRLVVGSPYLGYAPRDWTFQGSNDDSNWATLDTQTSHTSWSDGVWKEFTFANTAAYRYYKLDITNNAGGGGNTKLHEMEMMEAAVPNLQCYSESTIKQQGTYSLKGIAQQTGSLSDTLTRTVSPTKDLSGYNTIKVDTRANRTGSNFKISIHDSGGTTTEHTVSIASANTWQTETWDVSGVSSSNKDAIDQIIITITNADADNEIYVDDLRLANNTNINISLRDCNDPACSGDAWDIDCNNSALCDISSLTDSQYIQYKAKLETNHINYTPQLNTSSVVIGFEKAPPSVHLVSPANETATFTAEQTFSCNITDDTAIANLTLYIWNSTYSNIYTNITNLTG
ncbi:MAG: discoidin domain-containing protein, partial [Nanoarchaeota archaeon]|nr:discoidin domain-containing protein [Nanoarchaeota archaeon]